MKRVILQPVGKNWVRKDFVDFYYDSWAVQETYRDIWEESIGDIVLFVSKGIIFGIIEITEIIEDYEENKDYPLRYYWDKIKFVNIPMSDLNKIVGYSPKYVAHYYMPIKDNNIEAIFNFLDEAKSYESERIEYQRTVRKKFLLNIFWAKGEILLMNRDICYYVTKEEMEKNIKKEIEAGEEVVEYFQAKTGKNLVYMLMDNKHNLPYATQRGKDDYIEIFLISKKDKALKRMKTLIDAKVKRDMKRFILTREEYSEDKPYEEYLEESRIVIENDIKNRYYLAIFAPNLNKTSIKYEDINK